MRPVQRVNLYGWFAISVSQSMLKHASCLRLPSDACAIIEEQLQFVAEQLGQSRAQTQHIRRAPLLIEIHVTGRQPPAASLDPEVRPLLRISLEQPDHRRDESKGSWTGDSSDKDRPGLASPWFDVTIKHGRGSMAIVQHFPPSDLSGEQSLTVMSCGPAALCDEVRRQVKLTSAARRWKVVDYVEECFSW